MSVFLVDTNVLVYAYDPTDGTKRDRARDVLRRVFPSDQGVLSTQILGEFFTTVTRKIPSPLSSQQAEESVNNYAASIPVYDLTVPIVLEAVRGARRYQLHYFDALVWATAKLNQIPCVLTEDNEHGRMLESVRYLNPFHQDFDMSLLAVT